VLLMVSAIIFDNFNSKSACYALVRVLFWTDNSYYNLLFGGIDLKQIRARTFTLGVVLNPDGDHGPRLSLD
jgi:hypothetical protein